MRMTSGSPISRTHPLEDHAGGTKALVIINPNNPTGVVYSRQILEGLVQIAREHELLLLSDEIYDRILFDGAGAHPHRRPSLPICSA